MDVGSDIMPEFHLIQDLEVKCWDSFHVFWIIVLIIPGFLICKSENSANLDMIIPIGSYLYLFIKIDKFKGNEEFQKRYKFAFNQYKANMIYW
jgi:hypothetical protein